MQIPSLQIRQQRALIGIDADLGHFTMRQPRATFEMRTQQPRVEIEQPSGEMRIDQSEAWNALGRGGTLRMMNQIYSEARNVALQGIARIAQRGDRLAAIHTKANAIADIGSEEAFRFHEFNFVGEARYDNVDVRYTPRRPIIQVVEGTVDLTTHPNQPEIQYNRGKLDIYMRQYARVEITPPQIDVSL